MILYEHGIISIDCKHIKAKILLREPTREIMRVTIMRRSTKCVL